MRKIILPFLLCLVFFFLPIHIFVIGDDIAIGIQGAVYRYQTSGYGTSLIPITTEISYVNRGILMGKSALSVILWGLGSALLMVLTIFSLIRAENLNNVEYRLIISGVILSCIIYLGSIIAQYGFLFKGPAGFSIPFGIIIILVWIITITYYRKDAT